MWKSFEAKPTVIHFEKGYEKCSLVRFGGICSFLVHNTIIEQKILENIRISKVNTTHWDFKEI